MNELKIIKPKKVLKITFNKLGRFTFSNSFSGFYDFTEIKFAKFGFDDEENLHIKIMKEDDGESFKVLFSQKYHYVSIPKTMFKDFGMGKGENITFQLTEAENGFYKMEQHQK